MYIAQINSTNDYLKTHPNVDAVRTDFQTAGRGQMGNGWESEQGKNVLLSVRIRHHDLPATHQWKICIEASVILWQTIARYTDSQLLTIKWPNDLYYGDGKLAGMLIEHILCGNKITESIVGIGLNVNQTIWTGNAPNPTSIMCITGKENNVEVLGQQLEHNLRNIGATSANWESLYMQHLYRKTGFWWWEEREVSTEPTMNGKRSAQSFEAQIAGISPQGELILQTRNMEERKYHFKQIKYIQ